VIISANPDCCYRADRTKLLDASDSDRIKTRARRQVAEASLQPSETELQAAHKAQAKGLTSKQEKIEAPMIAEPS